MGTPLPPIYRDIRRLLVHTEGVVSRFARYHKYTVGTDMRLQAMQLMRCVHRAVYEPVRQSEHVGALVWLVDNYKHTLQLAMEVGAFTHSAKGTPSFAGFETAATLAAGIGKQCGGWQQATASRQRANNGSAPGGCPARRATACGPAAGQPRFTECLRRLYSACANGCARGHTMTKLRYPRGYAAALQVCRLGKRGSIHRGARSLGLGGLRRCFPCKYHDICCKKRLAAHPNPSAAHPRKLICASLAFWSSSPYVGNANNAWNVNFNNGNVNNRNNTNYVRLVRAGQCSAVR